MRVASLSGREARFLGRNAHAAPEPISSVQFKQGPSVRVGLRSSLATQHFLASHSEAPAMAGLAEFGCPSGNLALSSIDPLTDSRWTEFVEAHPRASIFHTTSWLEALRRTYGYEPVVYTTSPPGAKLRNGLAFCQVESWLTGRRLVSLPFSEYCEPLVDHSADTYALLSRLAETSLRNGSWRYIELRPMNTSEFDAGFFHSTQRYALHRLDLDPSLNRLFNAFHKSSTQRKIRRAEREGLRYEDGRSEFLLSNFYRLLIQTRRRHGIPPQPLSWFRNLTECLKDKIQIRVAFQGTHAVAAIVTLRFGDTLIYKYGSSDERFHSLGGMHFLLWNSIQEAKRAGLRAFDFGRSDWENEGLVQFKDRWGTNRTTLTYSRYTASSHSRDNYRPQAQWVTQAAKRFLAYSPDLFLSIVGKAMYKHIG